MWLQAEGFLDKVKAWWKSYIINGSPDFILVKLKNLKKDITLEQGAEKSHMLALQQEYQQLIKAEEISWRQKSRCLWLKKGDRNTKYFQKMANSHRSNNYIDKLKVGPEIIEDKDSIKREILDFYKKLYTEQESWRPCAEFEGLASISEEEKTDLELAFQEEEVLALIKSCAPDKASSPDGYTMAFFWKAWEFIKNDVMNALDHFHQHCYMVRYTNASFITLTPKKKGSIELKDFRPISLIGGV
ncbi:uncharacterized protein LOC142178115 [Nicotiana tabacum]|uniref:Uncharacterized protein LOC142178115 n=1 Tax=Nicotiana tabacum TaxID=4097 RepID=A0AC58U237_TOBAC